MSDHRFSENGRSGFTNRVRRLRLCAPILRAPVAIPLRTADEVYPHHRAGGHRRVSGPKVMRAAAGR